MAYVLVDEAGLVELAEDKGRIQGESISADQLLSAQMPGQRIRNLYPLKPSAPIDLCARQWRTGAGGTASGA